MSSQARINHRDIQQLSSDCYSEQTSVWQKSNLVNVPSNIISCSEFNRFPVPLRISGARDTAASLFSQLDNIQQPDQAGLYFQHYMKDRFGHNNNQKPSVQQRRYKNSYLKLLQDWGVDSNSAPAAVLKGWVESRFGLLPTYHKQPLKNLLDKHWIAYVEDKMNSRYHNNTIYSQLDLLYEFSQWFIQRFKLPAESYLTLYRGVNAIEEQCIQVYKDKKRKLIRFNNIVSFTDNEHTAGEFGDTILRVKIPMVKLVFFPALLPDHSLHGESEFLVLGGNYQAEKI